MPLFLCPAHTPTWGFSVLGRGWHHHFFHFIFQYHFFWAAGSTKKHNYSNIRKFQFWHHKKISSAYPMRLTYWSKCEELWKKLLACTVVSFHFSCGVANLQYKLRPTWGSYDDYSKFVAQALLESLSIFLHDYKINYAEKRELWRAKERNCRCRSLVTFL